MSPKKTLFLKGKALIILFTLLIVNESNAQPVYKSSDFANANDGYTISKSNISQFTNVDYIFDLYGTDFDTTGENILWDFSFLEPLSQVADTFLDPAETGLVDALIADCFSACQWDHTCYDTCGLNWSCYTKCHVVCKDSCISEMYQYNTNLSKMFLDTIDYELIQITDMQQFYLKTDSNLITDKFGYKLSSYGITLLTDIIPYDSTDVIYTFPMQYGNTDASKSSYEINAFDLIIWKHWQSRYNEVEGWGKLITPFGTFDSTLKVRTELYLKDTITWGGEQYSIPDTLNLDSIIEYKWFHKNYKLPVLTTKMLLMNGNTLLLDVSYIDSLRCLEPNSTFIPYPPIAFIDSTNYPEVTFMNLSVNADYFRWDFDDPSSTSDTSNERNPKYIFTQTGRYDVELIACNNICDTLVCDTMLWPLFVKDSSAAIAAFTTNPMFPCLGDTIAFTNTSANDTSVWWDLGDGTTSTDSFIKHYYTSGGIYYVTLVAYDSLGGTDTLIKELTIADTVSAAFTFSDTISHSPIQFTDSSAGVDSNTFYIWTFSGSEPSITVSVEKNPVVTFGTGGKATVCLSAWNTLGCKQTVCESINITNCLSANMITKESGCIICTNTNNFCDGDTIDLVNASTSDIGGPQTFEWWVNGVYYSGSEDTILALSNVIVDSLSEIPIMLIADNGTCTDTIYKWLNIKYPAYLDVIDDEIFICKGDTATLWVAFDNGYQGSYILSWSPEYALAALNKLAPLAYPDSSVMYTLTADFLLGTCDALVSYSDSVWVSVFNNKPTAQFNYNLDGYTVSITDSSIDAENLYVSFGEGDTIEIFGDTSYVYQDTGKFQILYVATNSCGKTADTATIHIKCTVSPNAGFSFTTNNLDKYVTFSDTSKDGSTFKWNFGDGDTSTIKNPTHIYPDTGNYNVKLWVYNNCGADSAIGTVSIVCPAVAAGFGYEVDTFAVSFFDSSVNATSWFWNFGDGANDSVQNTSHTYLAVKKYVVTQWAYNYCSMDSVIDTVSILNIGYREFSINGLNFKAYPNPFNGKTWIEYTLNENSHVQLLVYDILGKKIDELVNTNQQNGVHKINLDAEKYGYAKDVFIIKLIVGDKTVETLRISDIK